MGWFSREARCPVPDEPRRWVHERFASTARRLGVDAMRRRVTVMPTAEFFPGRFTASEESVTRLVAILCEPYALDPRTVTPQFVDLGRAHPSWPASLEKGPEGAVLSIDPRGVADAPRLAAGIARELAWALPSLPSKSLSEADDEIDALIDLTTVCFGLGVLTANVAIRTRGWLTGEWQSWEQSTMGSLSQAQYGYALAAYAHARGEIDPPWLHHVIEDIASITRKCLAWFEAGAEPPLRPSI